MSFHPPPLFLVGDVVFDLQFNVYVLYFVICPFVPFLAIVLSVPLRFIESECPLNIVKLYIEHFAISKINGADLSEILADRDARHYINNTQLRGWQSRLLPREISLSTSASLLLVSFFFMILMPLSLNVINCDIDDM